MTIRQLEFPATCDVAPQTYAPLLARAHARVARALCNATKPMTLTGRLDEQTTSADGAVATASAVRWTLLLRRVSR